MDRTLTDNYVSLFDARAYLDNSYNIFDGSPTAYPFFRKDKVKMQLDLFRYGSIRGRRLLEIGSGPTIDFAISPCPYFDEIYLSDFNEGARHQIELWRQEAPDAFDWSDYFKYITDLEGNRECWKKRESDLRSKLKAVLPCDVLKNNPLHPMVLEPFDCVITSNCLHTASANEQDFIQAVRNCASLLKPGGDFISFTHLDSPGYKVANQSLPTFKVDEKFNMQALQEAGLFVKTNVTRYVEKDISEKYRKYASVETYVMTHAIKVK